ncbi:MAG: Domain of Uncharacterized Function with structure, partial [Rhizobacter sp.]|nr:Domain of Uncharacterized Function with structure [Rhizobacter sp.]
TSMTAQFHPGAVYGDATARVDHVLKTDPEVFEAVSTGAKTFEIRFNDRDYQVGQRLQLRETTHTGAEIAAGAPLAYTRRSVRRTVSHVLSGYGLKDGWVCLSFAPELPAVTSEPPIVPYEGRLDRAELCELANTISGSHVVATTGHELVDMNFNGLNRLATYYKAVGAWELSGLDVAEELRALRNGVMDIRLERTSLRLAIERMLATIKQPLPHASASSFTDQAEFKNFHRLLCKRFVYVHDVLVWDRDLASLEDFIAMKLEAANALSAKAVAALTAITQIRNRTDGADWDEIEEARAVAEKALGDISGVTRGVLVRR